MATIEKEKALDVVRQMVADGQVSQEVAEMYFPELKEGERIRKAIQIYLYWLDGRKDYAPKGKYTIRDMLAWIEKQGKQKSANKEYTFKAIPRLLGMIQPTDRAKSYCQKLIDSLEQEGYSTDAKIVRDCLKQMNGEKVAMATMDEQKPAWSEEDEKIWKELIEEVKDQLDCVPAPDCRDKEDEKVLKQLNKWLSWLKSLKDRVGCEVDCTTTKEWSEEDEKMCKAIIDNIKAICEEGYFVGDIGSDELIDWLKDRVQSQPKQEWSERDKVILGKCLDAASGYYSPEYKQCMKDWLNSLKPRHTWKPSNEQMKFLYKYAEQNNYDGAILTSLYNDLEQLKQL